MDDEIKRVGALIGADDYKHGTRDPIFLVQQKRRVYGFDSAYTDESEWIDDNTGEPVGEEKSKRLTALDNAGRPVPDKYRQVFYQDHWEYVQACFTREGAEAFIARQKHNLKETRIWVDSLFRNQEMIKIREYLIAEGKK